MNDLATIGLEWLGSLALFLGFILLLRYLDHRERMSMIERGLLDATSAARPRYPRGSAVLRGGLITAMVGLAVTVGLYTLGYLLPAPFNAVPGRLGPWLLPGLIPLAVGVALIVSYYLSPPRPDQPQSSGDTAAPSDSRGDGDRDQAERGPSGRHRSGWHVVDHDDSHTDDTRTHADAANG